jgi:hypothetical protein
MLSDSSAHKRILNTLIEKAERLDQMRLPNFTAAHDGPQTSRLIKHLVFSGE